MPQTVDPFDPWIEEDNFPQGASVSKVDVINGVHQYLNDFPPGTTWDSTWMGDKYLVMGIHELLGHIKDVVGNGFSLRLIGDAAVDYIFQNSDVEHRNFTVLMAHSSKWKPSDNQCIDEMFKQVARTLKTNSNWAKDRSIFWSNSEPMAMYFFTWRMPGKEDKINVTIHLFNGTVRDYMDTCEWREDAAALAISQLPVNGNIFIELPCSVEDYVDSPFLTLSDNLQGDISDTLLNGLQLCERLHGKKIHINDFLTLTGMISLDHDNLSYIAGTEEETP